MLFHFKFKISLPKILIIDEIGVTTKKNITLITIGETMLPSNNPNLNQILFKGVRIFEFNKPKVKNIIATINDQNLIFPAFKSG